MEKNLQSHQLLNSYRGDIDGLRAIAVLGVIFFHFDLLGVSGGFIGVDIFFVISGYLITKQILGELEQGKFSFSGFYIRRVRRLFPALAATILLSLLMGFLLLSPEHLSNLAKSSISALLSISNFFFWSEAGYFTAASESKPLLHTWTLAVEEQYYLLWPILFFIVWKLKKPWVWRIVIALLMVVPILSVEYYIELDKAATFFLLPFRVSEFVIGGLIIIAERKYPPNGRIADSTFLLGLGAILYSLFMFTKETRFPGISALLPCIGTALMIWANPKNSLRYITNNRGAIWIGLISYSLYLWHWPILVFYKYWRFTPLSLFEQISLLIVCIFVSWLSYQYIEQPFRRSKKSIAKPHRIFLISCAVVFLVSMLSSIFIWRDDGMHWRLKGLPTSYAEQSKALPGKECYAKSLPLIECISGRNDKNKFNNLFLIGDSHGWALRVGITDLMGDHFRILNTHFSSCPPLLSEHDILKNHYMITDCRKLNSYLPQFFKNTDVTVLAARWALYLNGNPAGLEDLGGETFLLTRNGKTNSTQAEREAWFKDGLDITVAKLIKMKKKVILIAQVPPVGIDPVPCLSRPPFLIRDRNNSSDCRYLTRQQVLKRLGASNEIIKSVAKKQGVLALIPTEKLCPQKQAYCDIFSENQELLYRDDDHLNNYGSRYLIKLFEEEISDYLSSS